MKALYDVGLGPLKRYFEAFVTMDIWGDVSHDSVEEDEKDEFGARRGALEYATGVGECEHFSIQRTGKRFTELFSVTIEFIRGRVRDCHGTGQGYFDGFVRKRLGDSPVLGQEVLATANCIGDGG